MMASRTADRIVVQFYANSSRLADAFRQAAKINRMLARASTFRKWDGGALATLHTVHKNQVVILSHADDGYGSLPLFRATSPFAEAFHVLFTEPATHPDKIAQWIRTSRIRSEHRLHVLRMESLSAPRMSELLGRVCAAFEPDDGRGAIIDAYLAGDEIRVRGPMHRLLRVPIQSIAALRDLSQEDVQKFQIDPDGSFNNWPDIDVHLGWNQFLQAAYPADLHKAQQRSTDFNRRYGAAIRGIREAAGITQAGVAGITDRQLRRIEQGKCRATTAALNALANAHGLETNLYMDSLAKAMSNGEKSL